MPLEHGVRLVRVHLEPGQLTQASRSSRASRNTCATALARSTSSPFIRCRRTRRSCALSTSLAVRAWMKVMPPAATGSPCSRRVSRTAPSAASGTGFTARLAALLPSVTLSSPRCCAGSVLPAHAALTLVRSHEPSASRRMRPAFSARRTAVSLTPSWRASPRLLVSASIQRLRSQVLSL
jgi:hypothetical protein